MLSAIDGVRVAFLCTKNRSRLEEMALMNWRLFHA